MCTKRRAWASAVLAAGLALTACQNGSADSAAGTTTTHSTAAPAGTPVHVSTFEGDGTTYGVGMPIIVYFSTKITDARAFRKAVTVTVNGQKTHGAWYFEPARRAGDALEAHYRPRRYWPGHADIRLSMPLAGLPAGTGPTFADSLSLGMRTGAAQVSRIDGGAETMTITSDGQPVTTLRVSPGTAATPTYRGTAVVMAKANPERMKSDPGETPAYDIEVPWSVRVTNDGEFIHDAYWNGSIGAANLSHGCTNLSPADAEWYYGLAQVGDRVTWTNTGTSAVVPVDDGWGDWNLDWATYSRGGLLPGTGS